MKDNYPMLTQSQLREAPWNQKDDEPIDVDCCVSYCMSKTMPVEIVNYVATMEEDNLHEDNMVPDYDFDDVNFIEEYKNDDNAIGIPTLLSELQRLCNERIEQLRTEGIMLDDVNKEDEARILKEIKHYQTVLKASKDWVIDDLDVVKED